MMDFLYLINKSYLNIYGRSNDEFVDQSTSMKRYIHPSKNSFDIIIKYKTV